MAKRFMFVCLGLLALAVAYHLGASAAQSQATGTFVGIGGVETTLCAITATGDYYLLNTHGDVRNWVYWGNIAGGGTATQSSTWGQIKAEFGK